MYNGLRKIIQEVLLENKLFNRGQIESIIKRFKDGSDELKNQLAIFGLFRQQAPFNQIQDISQLQSKEQLASLFYQWFEKAIGEMIKTKNFIDNKYLAQKYLQAYVDNVNSLGANARPFSMKNIEKELVDVVLNNNWIQETKQRDVNVYNPNDSDIVYKDDDIWIMKGDTKAKCVLYGYGQKWCISRADINHYTTYRINNQASIYFCMQPKIKGVEHTFVILNYGEYGYGLADQTNDGDRNGQLSSAMLWDEIEEEIPNLRGKQEYFKQIPVTYEERNYDDIVSKKYIEEDIGDYIITRSKYLTVNGSKISPEDFIRDYASRNELTEKQKINLALYHDGMTNSYIEIGGFFSLQSFEYLSKKQQRRVIEILLNKYDTDGRGVLADYMIPFASDEQKTRIFDSYIESDFLIKKEHLPLLSQDQLEKYLKNFQYIEDIPEELLKMLRPQTIQKYIQKEMDGGWDLNQNFVYNYGTPEQIRQYSDGKLNSSIQKINHWEDQYDDLNEIRILARKIMCDII